MMATRYLLAVLVVGVCFSSRADVASAAVPSARSIVAKSLKNYYYAGADTRVRVEMTLINSGGKKRKRKLSLLRKNFGQAGDQRYYVFFHAPADVKGTSFMVWKYPRKDDDRWIFMPAINLVRRIAASDKRSSFIGSDFTYEDLSGREVSDERHVLKKEEKLDGRNCYVIESRPTRSMDYVRRLSWVDKQHFLPLKEEYYDRHGKLTRLFEAKEIKKVGGHFTAMRRVMKNVQTGHRTEVLFKKAAYNVGLGDELFNENALRRPPRAQLK